MNLTPGGNQYTVHVVNLPYTVLAAVAATDSDTYHVFINDALSPTLRQQALEHELRHIDAGHLYNDVLTISEMEQEADGRPVPKLLPNVFRDLPPGHIPLFNSLQAYRDYMFAMARQMKEQKRDKI